MTNTTQDETTPVICLDGPAGVGKGTICLLVARELGWHILDSGSLYRITALAFSRRYADTTVDAVPESQVADIADNLDVSYIEREGSLQILLDGEDVSEAIRAEAIGVLASQVAALPAVRAALLARQRAFRRPPGLVADGRDMGTVVFPDAPLKIYLTATAEERANRRYKQLKEKGIDVKLADLVEELRERDARDMNRKSAPLKPADDALIIDTTSLSIDEVGRSVMQAVADRLPQYR